MVRKRLTDLLREELQKPDEATVATPAESDPATDAVAPAVETAAKDSEAAAKAAAEAAATIAHLKTSLEQTQHRETTLKDQVADLQAQLDEQKKLVKSLQADVKRAETFKKDLNEARKDALQLAEANTKLSQEVEALQKPPSQPATAIAKATPSTTEARQRQARALSHPVFPNEPLPSQGAGLDTGWMD